MQIGVLLLRRRSSPLVLFDVVACALSQVLSALQLNTLCE